MKIEISEKYENLFTLPDDVSIYIVTGGRNSQKSFATGLSTCVNSVTKNHRVLYTRYTLVSADDSIVPEFTEKIDILGWEDKFSVKQGRIDVSNSRGKIVFKGIKTSSGNQTASLKSLKDFSMFVLEEAEEMPNFEDWDKIWKSIRSTDVKPIAVLILNPTTKEHWIYKHFFEDKGVREGFNGVKDGVCYIHTSYKDIPRKFIPDNIYNEFEQHRLNYELFESTPKDEHEYLPQNIKKSHKYYKHTVLGGWLEKAEGIIYEDWEIGEFDNSIPHVHGLDFGSNDPDACVKVAVDYSAKNIYLEEKLFKNNLSTDELSKMLDVSVGKNELIIADSAGKRTIEDLYYLGFDIEKTRKKDVAHRIKTIQGYTLIVSEKSVNLQKALNNYRWKSSKHGIPDHDWSDLCDAFGYGAMYLIEGGGSQIL